MNVVPAVHSRLPSDDVDAPDLERRFGGLRRLYGALGYARLRRARVAIVGVGGVGSWAAEALARSGVAALVLIDLDHVAESNINRQVQANSDTIGQAKVIALRDRVARIHPGCEVRPVEAFAEAGTWPAPLEGCPVDVLVDACDQARAKLAIAVWAHRTGTPLVCVGAAGGKRAPQRVEVADLADTTHDPLLARLRQGLRQRHGAPRRGPIGVRCVFSREAVAAPWADAAGDDPLACAVLGDGGADAAARSDGSLSCHGYGSSVAVTATFGLTAAAEALARCVDTKGLETRSL